MSEEQDLIERELKIIKINQELSDEYRKQPLTETGYIILKAFNNHTPGETGLRFKPITNRENNQPTTFIKNVANQVNMSEEEFQKEIKILFLKGYVDYAYKLDQKLKDYIDKNSNLKLDEALLKYGEALNINCSPFGQGLFHLTDRGFFAMVDYALKEMKRIEESLLTLQDQTEINVFKQFDQLQSFQNKQEQMEYAFNKSNENLTQTQTLSEKVDGDLKKATESISKINIKISKFNENIFTIFSIMIAAFAVIGININSIPNIKDNFFLSILAINFSVCFSLVVLFYLLKVVVYNEKKTGLEYLLIGFGLIFLLTVITQSEYWTKIYNLFN